MKILFILLSYSLRGVYCFSVKRVSLPCCRTITVTSSLKMTSQATKESSFAFLPKLLLSSAIAHLLLSSPLACFASDVLELKSNSISQVSTESSPVPVYFGIGCFWHVQHEFVQAEKKILGRSDDQVTSTAGYAGGSKVVQRKSNDGSLSELVCYHNLQGIADYGSLGHGEVVGLAVPASSYPQFAKEYFSLFSSDLNRPDKGDRGAEYRSLVGIPGGTQSPLYPALAAAADARGLRLVEGAGNDGDTLDRKLVWVMDSSKFKFHPAELYHQFHDGFMPGEQYPQSYNSLAKLAYDAGRIGFTGCPDTEPR